MTALVAKSIDSALHALQPLFERHGIDVVVHLAAIVNPGRDHDLIRCAVHAAVFAKVGGNLGAQVFIPLHITPLQQLRPLVHQFLLDAPPAAGRKEGSIYTAG